MTCSRKSTCIIFQALFLLLCLSKSFAFSKLTVYKKKCTGNTEMFDINYASIACYGDCTFGSEGVFSATYTIGDELSTNEPFVTVKVLNVEAFNETIDICNNGMVSNDNGYYCPSLGTYSTYTPLTFPGSQGSLYSKLTLWWSFSALATFDFNNAEVECQFKVQGTYATASKSIFSCSTIALIFFTYRSRRRRLLMVEPLRASRETTSNFIKMGDEG